MRARPGRRDNILPEARRVDADVVNVSDLVTATACPPPRLAGLAWPAACSLRCLLGLVKRYALRCRRRGALMLEPRHGDLGEVFQNRTGLLLFLVGPALFRLTQLVVFTVRMFVAVVVFMFVLAVLVSVRMPVAAKHHETDEVRGEAEAANNEDELRVGNLGGLEEPGDGLEDDGDAKRDQEDGVEEGAQDLCAQPAVGVLVGSGLARQIDSPQSDQQRYDVVEHVEGIGGERKGLDNEASDELDKEEDDVDAQHDADAGGFGPRHPACRPRAPDPHNDATGRDTQCPGVLAVGLACRWRRCFDVCWICLRSIVGVWGPNSQGRAGVVSSVAHRRALAGSNKYTRVGLLSLGDAVYVYADNECGWPNAIA